MDFNLSDDHRMIKDMINRFIRDTYDFESYEITLTAVSVPTDDLSILVYSLVGGIIGLVSVFSA